MRALTNKVGIAFSLVLVTSFFACAQNKPMDSNLPKIAKSKVEWNKLTAAENEIIANKGTERPGTGPLLNNKKTGTYICRRCNQPLYLSESKFESHTGWPSFDDEIKGAVKHKTDADGQRTELLCANCGAHLGHAFYGEHFTKKDTRNCINSLSLAFIEIKK